MIEHAELTKLILTGVATDGLRTMSLKQQAIHLLESRKMIDGTYYPHGPHVKLAAASGVGELFAYRLSHKCGVHVPEITLTASEPTDFQNFYVRKIPRGWALSKRIPRALPLYYLTDQCEVLPPFHRMELALVKKFERLLDKRCPIGRDAYPDFPTEAPTAALRAAQWNSEQRSLVHCFRALLYCSYGHVSNCLVDVEGKLWSIDHEKLIYTPNTDDIHMLDELIGNHPLRNLCAQLAAGLTTEDIEQSLSDIPNRFWDTGKFQQPRTAIEYFSRRLEVWQRTFTERGELANAV